MTSEPLRKAARSTTLGSTHLATDAHHCPRAAAATIAAALPAQLVLFASTDRVGAVTMRAAEDAGDARAAGASMARKYPVGGRAMYRAALVATRHLAACRAAGTSTSGRSRCR